MGGMGVQVQVACTGERRSVESHSQVLVLDPPQCLEIVVAGSTCPGIGLKLAPQANCKDL